MHNSKPPGIFNDAIGPIMRGPSSSHTAGSHRIGSVLRQMASATIKKAVFSFHPEGSLATTYQTQGSDIGLAAGLLGLDITDSRMPDALAIANQENIEIQFRIEEYPADHPNTYLCEITTLEDKKITATALSTGGGLIEFVKYSGFDIDISFDLPVLFYINDRKNLQEFVVELESLQGLKHCVYQKEIIGNFTESLLCVLFNKPPSELTELNKLQKNWNLIEPVYPVIGYTGSLLPFTSAKDLENSDELQRQDLWELALEYEVKRSDIGKDDVISRMNETVDIFRSSITTGLNGTSYDDRILGAQSPSFMEAMKKNALLPAGPLNRMMAYTMAIMESKSAMEVIIAAPTAGSAGGLPGAILGMADEIKAEKSDIVKAFLAAGIIGVFISKDATFAAEVAGCQAETGVGAAMAAAGLIQLAGGTAKQALGAASLALQNIMGLVCDPVGNRVEVPCLGRNVQSAANALSSANMILGGIDPIIPLSESITTMLEVGQSLPRELRCTALGGLAATPTAREIEKKLLDK